MRSHAAMRQHPRDPTGEDAPDASRRPTDEDVRRIAAQLVREASEPPPADPSTQLSAQQYELASVDEERVDAALVALAAVEPAATVRADHEAGPAGPSGTGPSRTWPSRTGPQLPREAPRRDPSDGENGATRGA